MSIAPAATYPRIPPPVFGRCKTRMVALAPPSTIRPTPTRASLALNISHRRVLWPPRSVLVTWSSLVKEPMGDWSTTSASPDFCQQQQRRHFSWTLSTCDGDGIRSELPPYVLYLIATLRSMHHKGHVHVRTRTQQHTSTCTVYKH